MINELIALRAEMEALKNTVARLIQVGTVEELDAEKGYRLKLGEGEDGKPFLSPFYPHPETGKTSVPLKKNQIMVAINPGGDPRQGLLVRGGYSDEHKSPNENLEANVFKDAGVTIEIVDGKVVITANTAVTVNAPKVELGGEGGKPVARIGDKVHVMSGSSAGMWPIVEGSSVVTAVD